MDEITIDIQSVSANEKKWDESVLSHPRSTFFHLMGWQRVLEKTFPYECFSLIARKGDKVCGVLPLYRVKRLPFGSAMISTPMAVYGGACADDDKIQLALMERAKEIGQEMGVDYLEFRNQKPFGDLATKELYVTFRKEIFKDEEKNMAAIRRFQRRSIRKGKKNNLEARIGREEFLEDFYDIYSHSVRNLGTPVYPRQLFCNLLEEFGENCKILGVFKQGKMVSAILTFFFKDQVLPYYGGAYKYAYQYSVYDFMYWSLMCYGAENGYKIFDAGRSEKGSGSYHFKRHWGFIPEPLAYQYILVKQKDLPNLSPSNPEFSLPIKIWKRLPFGFTRWLGPKIIKYFP